MFDPITTNVRTSFGQGELLRDLGGAIDLFPMRRPSPSRASQAPTRPGRVSGPKGRRPSHRGLSEELQKPTRRPRCRALQDVVLCRRPAVTPANTPSSSGFAALWSGVSKAAGIQLDSGDGIAGARLPAARIAPVQPRRSLPVRSAAAPHSALAKRGATGPSPESVARGARAPARPQRCSASSVRRGWSAGVKIPI